MVAPFWLTKRGFDALLLLACLSSVGLIARVTWVDIDEAKAAQDVRAWMMSIVNLKGFDDDAQNMAIRGGKAAVPALVHMLQDRRPGVRESAAWMLGEIGPNARGAAAALVELQLVDPSHDVRRRAATALDKIGYGHPPCGQSGVRATGKSKGWGDVLSEKRKRG